MNIVIKKYSHLLILSLCFCLFPFMTSAQDVSVAPPIFYYSRDEQAFIIERADGSDREILAHYELPCDPDYDCMIDGAGWSPSGNWFSWRRSFSPPNQTIYLVQRETHKVDALIPLPNHIINKVLWSPTDDLLMLHILTTDFDAAQRIYIYDPSQLRMIAAYGGGDIFRASWSSQGQLLLVYKDRIEEISFNGATTHVQQIGPPAFSVPSPACFDYPHRLRDGEIAYLDRDLMTWVIENPHDHTQLRIPIPQDGQGSGVYGTEWSPNENYAFIYLWNRHDRAMSIWLLSIPDQSFSQLANGVERPSPNCAEILFRPPFEVWSTNNKAIFVTPIDNEIAIYEGFFIDPVDKFISSFGISLYSSTRPHLRWSEDGKWIFFVAERLPNIYEREQAIFSYNMQTRQLNILSPWKNSREQMAVGTMRNGYLPYGRSGQFFLLDLASGLTLKIDHTYSLTYRQNFSPEDFVWHPSNDWIYIAFSDLSLDYIMTVVDPQTGYHRDVTICTPTVTCFGWLPENVQFPLN
jgi:hypothetical protein